MDADGLQGLEHLQGLADDDDFDPTNLNTPNFVNMEGVLNGSEQIELSHAGGELGSLEEDLEEDTDDESAGAKTRQAPKAEDWRTRRDRTERRNLAFESQMPEMVTSYVRYCAEQATAGGPLCTSPDEEEMRVQEVYEIRVVDMFRYVVFLEGTSVVDENGIAPALVHEGLLPCGPWEPTVAITVRVLEAYRIQHARCPQLAIQSFVKSLCDMHGVAHRPYLCQQFSIAYDLYLDIRRRTDERLEGEDKLIFDMLTTMDSNDSLKRVLRRNKTSMAEDEGGRARAWQGGGMGEDAPGRGVTHGVREFDGRQSVRRPMEEHDRRRDVEDVGDFSTKRVFFLALCRHGFVLVIADMIRSGELAKYPLAIVEELLDTFGMNLGAGYDIGCHFGATAPSTAYAHNRLCQLSFLAHVRRGGMGLEDLEGCERYFSRSNGLAKSCRYASRFHRQQEITTYAKHFDSFETYANLSKFLCTKYRQALGILKTEPVLQKLDAPRGRGRLCAVPRTNEETLEMEYVQKLINLSASEAKYSVLLADTRRARADDAPRHGKEKVDKDLETVQELERQLDIADRWTTASPRWVSTTVAIKKRKYLLALDALELLIVERIFELTKMNQSQTGYKMRKHIAKALQARSKAQVVEYAFLADFDILRDTRAEIQSRPWTRPAYRLAMDRYFKILRARGGDSLPECRDSSCCHLDPRRRPVLRKEAELSSAEGKSEEEADADRGMAVQVRLYRERHGRFDNTHMRRFWALAKTPRFTGSGRGGEEGWVEEEDEGDDAMEEAVSDLLYTISMVAVDDKGPQQVEES
ncbi:hypothetical protein B0H14DRAFT_3471049 [Mycena olivaceomarginata]|nr:hypothetical protein B0H14DRAFT_3471049 [Mycena olivaceomarginata]